MPAKTRYFVRVYGNTQARGLHLLETIPALNEKAVLSAAYLAGKDHAGALAVKVIRDDEGRKVVTVLGRYGQVMGFG